MDMSHTIIPRSDQLNSDDLISGPRTITVTRVSANESSAEQPVNVYYEGDNGKPFRPCKSVRRVMVQLWGVDASAYVGRSMTLYRDPDVTWGGMKVGGIRISHMSHIDRDQTLVLTVSKASRKPYVVKPLRTPPELAKSHENARKLEEPQQPAQPDNGVTAADGGEDDPVIQVVAANGQKAMKRLSKGLQWLRDKADDPGVPDDEYDVIFANNAGWVAEHVSEIEARVLRNARAEAAG